MKRGFILAIFGVFISSLIYCSNTFADSVQSYSYTFDNTNITASSNLSEIYLYNSGNDINYQNPFNFTPLYVKVVISNFNVSNGYTKYSFLRANTGAGNNTNLVSISPYYSSEAIINISDLHSGYIALGNFGNCSAGSDNPCNTLNNQSGTASVTITFYSDFPSDCVECEDCEDPEENSRFIQVVIDAFWKYHIAFAGAVPAIIVIFLVYRLLKGRIK